MLADFVVVLSKYFLEYSNEVLLFLIGFFLAYELVVYPFFLSPLKDIPGPYLHRISNIFALDGQRAHKWIETVHDLHKQYGDVVLISPNEISLNGKSDYINDLYIKNFPKSTFYENFRNHGFKDNIFASLENDRHLRYKKLIMGLYSKSNIFSKNSSFRENLVKKIGKLCDQVYISSVSGTVPDIINAKSEVNEHGKGHNEKNGKWFNPNGKEENLGIDVYNLFGSLAMDVVSGFELGEKNGTDFLSKPEEREIVVYHRMQASMVFWTTLMPRFWNLAAGKSILNALKILDKWRYELYYGAEKNTPKTKEGQHLTVLETLKKNGLKGDYAYSFLTDNIFAGHETTAIQLSYLSYELSRPINSKKQERLRDELVNAFGKPASREDIIDNLEKVDQLPFLSALLEENSRVHTSIPGSEPRVVDSKYDVTLSSGKKIRIPRGTIISCQPYSMHREESVFPHPDNFIPERWLKDDNESEEEFKQRVKKQQKFMMPFGKGIRMCLGMNIALIEMKLAIANLYWHYNSKVCTDWCEMVQYEPSMKLPNPIKIGLKNLGANRTDEEKMTMFDSYTTRPLNDECWLEWYSNYEDST